MWDTFGQKHMYTAVELETETAHGTPRIKAVLSTQKPRGNIKPMNAHNFESVHSGSEVCTGQGFLKEQILKCKFQRIRKPFQF